MPGLTVPRRLPRLQGFKASVPSGWWFGAAFALTLLAGQTDCGFPNYDFSPVPTGGAAGSNGGSAGAGSGGSGAHAGNSGSAGIAGDAAGAGDAGMGAGGAGGTAGAAGEAGAAGVGGGETCVYPPPVIFPAHCLDNSASGNETGLDCGGPDCLPCEMNQPCAQDSDCASGTCTQVSHTCTQVLSVQYTSIVTNAFTVGPKFRLLINYMDAKPTVLSALRIRYYFNHNGVAEPVIALDTQATFNSGTTLDISNKVNARVFRLPPGPPAQRGGQITDSYLELSFASGFQVAAGASIDLTTDIVAANQDVQFQQSTHYSFANVATPTPADAITVFRDQQRVWGMEPPLTELPDCAFAAGVNLGGPGVTLGTSSTAPTLAAAANATDLAFSGTLYSSSSSTPLPWADANTAKMLSSAFTFTGTDTATWSVPGGQYWLYAWLTSAASADTGVLAAEGMPLDKFCGVQKGSSAGWARLGPYPISIGENALHLSAAGKVNVAGLELYRRQP